MSLLEAIVLALVQGLTEFLPISSSAHLILVPRLIGWPDQGLSFDVAVHLGTLLAVAWYFRDEIWDIVRGWCAALVGRAHEPAAARLGWALLLATLPVVIAGFAFEDIVETQLRSPLVIATTTALFGVLLWVVDRRRDTVASERDIGYGIAFAIGLAQAVALIPGTSRSGITITAGLALGLSRSAAARFSFLLSIPAITGAALLKSVELARSPNAVDWLPMAIGCAVSAVSAYACIRLFLNTIERIGMLPFMIYRLLLAGLLIWLFL